MAKRTLLFQTGFESGTRGLPADAHEVFNGVDHSVAPPNDWRVFRRPLPHPWSPSQAKAQMVDSEAPQLGFFDIAYLGGTVEDRFARIIEDPTSSGNHVLQFSITRANEKYPGGSKARVQADIYQNINLTAMSSRLRMYLHPDLAVLHAWEVGFQWLTLQEYWFDPGWEGGEHSFRITLGLCREAGPGRKDLHFSIHGQPIARKGTPVYSQYPGWDLPTWEGVQQSFAVPIGVWLECEVDYRMGNAQTGRFTFRVRPAGGDWVSLFDITNWTYNPLAPQPQPLYGWNPMKLYTSAALVDYVRSCGGVTQVYWDDFAVFV